MGSKKCLRTSDNVSVNDDVTCTHSKNIKYGKDRNVKSKEELEWDDAFKRLIVYSQDADSFDKNYDYMSSLAISSEEKRRKAIVYFKQNYRQHYCDKISYHYRTNNLVESWWNLVKNKFKTARSFSYKKVDKWINLFLIRYKFNHIDNMRKNAGMIFIEGKRFEFSQFPDFKSVIRSVVERLSR
ncbi:MAG: hypothetical protein ACLFR2_11725 [Candidatus Kapaibacterium sp.]